MSNGGAQAHVITLTAYPSFKLYHFIEGTSTPKDIYTDEAMTTPAAQPMVADATGTIQFYGDGMYKFVIDDSTDVTKHTWDNVRVSSDLATMGVNFGTTVPDATTANQGQLFAEHTVTTKDLEAIWINHGGGAGGVGPVFKKILDFASGTIKYADIVLGGPVIDVRYYDAVGDGVTDDSAAIQAAASAIPATGGVLYFPKGTYLMTADIDILNKSCRVTGDGIGQSIIKWSTGSDYGIDFDTTLLTDVLIIDNISLRTDVVGGGDAVNASWSSAATYSKTFIMRDVEISNTVAAVATSYFTRGVYLSNSFGAQIDSVVFRGKLNDKIGMTSYVEISGSNKNLLMSNCNGAFAQYAVNLGGTLELANISNNTFEYVDNAVETTFASGQVRNIFSGNNIVAFKKGINCVYLVDSIISGNIIAQSISSTEDFVGIEAASTSPKLKINDNTVKGPGTSGTDTGVLISGSGCIVSNNYVEDQDTGISADATSTDNSFNGNMATSNTVNYADAGTNNGWDDYGFETPTIDIASATTITLPTVGRVFNMTGSTAVTTINGGWDGRIAIFTITTPHAVTFTNTTGNLEMNADFPLGDKDTLTFVYTNSKWRVNSLSANV